MSGGQFKEWLVQHEEAEVEKAAFKIPEHPWERCLSSDSCRALHTARTIYAGDAESRMS
ncbi:hypothetical protein D3C81_2226140 [compost metagenome]